MRTFPTATAAVLAAGLVLGTAPNAQAASIDPAAPTSRLLMAGSHGPAVKKAQRQLGIKPATGFYGPQTKKAVKRFQRQNGLPVTGILTQRTLKALNRQSLALAEFGAKPTLQFGMRSPDVSVLQGLLGISPTTGYFGPTTLGKVNAFKVSVGLAADGIVDSKVWKKLAKLGTTPAPPAPVPTTAPPSTTAPAPAPVAPGTPWITPGQENTFYAAVLVSIGAPTCSVNLKVMDAWKRAEGPVEPWNPWNTTQRSAGSTVSPNGSTRFPSFDASVGAHRMQLTSLYAAVVNGFKACDATVTITAIVQSPWAEGHYFGKDDVTKSSIWRIYFG